MRKRARSGSSVSGIWADQAGAGGLRLGGQQGGVDVGGLPAAAARSAQLGAVGGLALAEQKVVGAPLHQLAGLETERFGAGTPPAARRLAAGLAGPDVIAGRVGGQCGVDLLPDVVQVVALGQGGDNRQTGSSHREPKAAELTMVIGWRMGVTGS